MAHDKTKPSRHGNLMNAPEQSKASLRLEYSMADYLYIHIPFCMKKCFYCDFLSVPYESDMAEKYIDALCRELYLRKHSAGRLRTVFIGGGTPTVLPSSRFKELFGCIREHFDLLPDAEITVEANPCTLDASRIDALHSAGVNRISIGIQSFIDHELLVLGRTHSACTAVSAVEEIRRSGLANVSIDLIYGIPGQTIEMWEKNLALATALSPSHISAYELTPEKGTPLSTSISAARTVMPDEDSIVAMYAFAVEYLASGGYAHYEVSNYSLPGFQCIHNLNYWNRGEYLGAGAGAHSFLDGLRSSNTKNIAEYIHYLNNGLIPQKTVIPITPEEAAREFLFLGLRKIEGIRVLDAEMFAPDILSVVSDLVNEGYAEVKHGYLRLTEKGLVISNSVILKLFEKLGF